MYEDNILNMGCDYILTMLKLGIEYGSLHYLLKATCQLNHPKNTRQNNYFNLRSIILIISKATVKLCILISPA